MKKIVEIDGNDGTGKTRLVNYLIILFEDTNIEIKDRGQVSRWTISPQNEEVTDDIIHIVLDCFPQTSQNRIEKRGDSLNEEFHTLQSLKYYREKYIEATKLFPFIKLINVEKDCDVEIIASIVINIIFNEDNFNIFLPSGRLFKNTIKYLNEHNIDIYYDEIERSYNKIKYGYNFIKIKPKSIPQLMSYSTFKNNSIGFLGEDLINDSIYYEELNIIHKTGLNKVSIKSAIKKDLNLENLNRPLIIASEFENLVFKFYPNQAIYLINTYGSTEAYKFIADMIIDIVETGETMEKNNWEIYDTLMYSETVLLTHNSKNVFKSLHIKNLKSLFSK